MAHCGYEASAVEDAMQNPLKAAWVALLGPRTWGEMAPEPVPEYEVDPKPIRARPAIRIQAVD
jgi:hypothetical protein